MVISIHGISKEEVKDVAHVAVWVVAAYALALVGARLAHYHFSASVAALGVPGYVNLAVYAASKFVSKEVSDAAKKAVGALPQNEQAAGAELAAKVEQEVQLKTVPNHIPYQNPVSE